MTIIIIALTGVAVFFATLGILALISRRGSMSERIQGRLQGVRQIKDFELGDALAQVDEKKKSARRKHKELVLKKAFSEIPVLQQRFSGQLWAEKLQARLRQAQLPLTLTSFIVLSVACGMVGALLTLVWRRELNVFMPLGFLVFFVAPYLYVTAAVTRRMRKFSEQFPDALDLLSSSVKSGMAFGSAIQNVAEEMPEPVCDEFRILTDELSIGVDMTEALQHFGRRVTSPDVQFFCTALVIQKEVGGNLSEVLDGLQKTIRERFRILRQVRTLTAQGRLSGWIVGALPFALAAIISWRNWNYMSELFNSAGPGPKLLVAAGVLQVIGILMIRKIVNIKV